MHIRAIASLPVTCPVTCLACLDVCVCLSVRARNSISAMTKLIMRPRRVAPSLSDLLPQWPQARNTSPRLQPSRVTIAA